MVASGSSSATCPTASRRCATRSTPPATAGTRCGSAGTDPAVREVAAAHADGWNKWGGSVRTFRAQADGPARRRGARSRSRSRGAGSSCSAPTDDDAAAKAARLSPSAGTIVGGPERVADGLREYVDAGAEWIIVGPIDSADPENASMLGELVAPLLGEERRLLAGFAASLPPRRVKRDLLGILEVPVDVLRVSDTNSPSASAVTTPSADSVAVCACDGRRPSRVGRRLRARRRSAWACGT